MNTIKKLGLVALAVSASFANAATLNIESASDWGNGSSSYPASNTIDGSLAWASRWAASGSPVNLQLDLGSVKNVTQVGVSWGRGGERVFTFEIWARAATSGTWTKVYDDVSTGTTSSIEVYDITPIDAQQVRIKTFSNSAGTDWTDIKEVEVYGGTSTGSSDGELEIGTAFDDGTGHSSYPATNAIDDSTDWSSRWAASNDGGATNLTVELNEVSDVTEVGVAWGKGNTLTYTFEIYARESTSDSWTKIHDSVSSGSTSDIEVYDVTDISAQQIRLKAQSNSAGSDWMNVTEVKVYGSAGSGDSGDTGDLDSSKAPSENFDLSKWYLSVPIDNGSGVATSIDVDDLNKGYESSKYFYTGSDGGMVFVNYPKDAVKTSTNTTYSRTELREMLYGDDASAKDAENNWYFSSSSSIPSDAGGTDGTLTATVAVNRVTTTSDSTSQVGRIIIGQIHASSNEPSRLYYHKQPGHSKGAIYVAHETYGSDETFYNIIGDYVVETGDKAGDYTGASSPSDGIELGEVFSYKIKVVGNGQWVTISREGKSDITQYIDMSDSDYENDYMYFKAGVYSQNKTCSSSSDYDQVTFYSLKQSHN
ncbi:polysaccharide lyase family 7 protein [Psychromonas sp.]|nr:polysaccharide lyase family 7 protein [Psychromonas sp.]